MSYTIDMHSPERAWQPFMDWMTANGMNPSATYRVDIDPDAMTATVHCFKLRNGKKYVDRRTDEAAKDKPKTVAIDTLPPTRIVPVR